MNYWMKKHAGCIECGRRFDLMVEAEADEWYHGHDCEVEEKNNTTEESK